MDRGSQLVAMATPGLLVGDVRASAVIHDRSGALYHLLGGPVGSVASHGGKGDRDDQNLSSWRSSEPKFTLSSSSKALVQTSDSLAAWGSSVTTLLSQPHGEPKRNQACEDRRVDQWLTDVELHAPNKVNRR